MSGRWGKGRGPGENSSGPLCLGCFGDQPFGRELAFCRLEDLKLYAVGVFEVSKGGTTNVWCPVLFSEGVRWGVKLGAFSLQTPVDFLLYLLPRMPSGLYPRRCWRDRSLCLLGYGTR